MNGTDILKYVFPQEHQKIIRFSSLSEIDAISRGLVIVTEFQSIKYTHLCTLKFTVGILSSQTLLSNLVILYILNSLEAQLSYVFLTVYQH